MPSLSGIFILLVLITVLAACSSPPPALSAQNGGGATIDLVISRDFGRIILKHKTLELTGSIDALSALKKAAEVETGYGGAFVNGIDRLRTEYSLGGSKKQDWFFYVNGLEANTGSADYPLFAGDIQQWDFHDWSFRHFIPAMIGHFPQPFLNGCRAKVYPTLVVYQSGFKESALKIKELLNQKGVEGTQIRPEDQLTLEDKENSNIILLAGPQSEIVRELDREWKRLGFFAYFDSQKLVSLDINGKVSAEYIENTGLIQATQNPWNPNGIGANENTLWIITGTDQNGISGAIEKFISNPSGFQFSYSALISQGEIIQLP